MTEIFRLSGMKSFRDDLIARMKTGWGRFVLASKFISFYDLKYTYTYKAVKRILILFKPPLLVQRNNGTNAGLDLLGSKCDLSMQVSPLGD